MENPLILQESWLNKLVLNSVSSTRYNNRVVLPEIIGKINKAPILRITNFITKTDNNSFSCQFADATNRIYGIIPFESIVQFEQKYRRNLTSGTRNNLIVVKLARLVFYGWREIEALFKQPGLASIDYVALQVLDFEIFLRDNFSFNYAIEDRIRMIYEDPSYIQKCGRKNNTKDLWDELEFDYQSV